LRNPRQNSGQNLPAILGRMHRLEVDPEMRCWVERGRRRQQLLGERPQQLRLAVEQFRTVPSRSAAGPQDQARGVADLEYRAGGRAGCRSFPSRSARAREAEKDQDQVVEIPGLEARETGDNRRSKVDQE
jgi:hypothetical protein